VHSLCMCACLCAVTFGLVCAGAQLLGKEVTLEVGRNNSCMGTVCLSCRARVAVQVRESVGCIPCAFVNI
jgi:hypothetical protein